jgi:DNA-binding transcriptional regulator/RsmH inhibitor MraZ
MNKELIIEEMYDCLDSGNLNCFENQVKNYLEISDINTASRDLATFLVKQYTAARADTISRLMEIIIRCNPTIALINYPENHFFKIVMISGSLDLFECYTEEAIEPHLEDSSEEDYKEYYKKLLHMAAKLNTLYADQYQPQIKGQDFNGAFPNSSDSRLLSIHPEDFEIMNDLVDKYNTIVGRRDIIKALMTMAGMKF